MKALPHLFATLPQIITILILNGCSNDIRSYDLDKIGGEAFPFHSPITALTESDSDSTLLIGTANGVIASFSTFDGLFTPLDRERDGKTIYDIAVNEAGHFYAVRDDGVHWKKEWGDKDTVYKIKKPKYTEYSPYKILLDSNRQRMFASTSNGAYIWSLDNPDETIKPERGKPDYSPLSYFSISEDEQYGYVLGGLDGAFHLGKDLNSEWERFENWPHSVDTSIVALHHGFFMLKDGSFWKNYESPERIHDFKHKPLNFVIDSNYVYAISFSFIEVVSLNEKDEKYVVRLPEKHLNRERNKSCRQNGIINGRYLYVAPGGSTLYRIPLAPYDQGEEVISLCRGGFPNEIYALTAKNDLFSLLVDGNGKPRKPRYLYSFNRGDQVRLLGSSGEDTLVVSVGDSIYTYSHHTISGKPRYLTSMPENDKSITCNYWHSGGDILFQGRKDMVRAYRQDYDRPIFSFPKKQNDSLDCREGVSDYNPERMALVKYDYNNDIRLILVVATLHSGVACVNVLDSNALFKSLIKSSDYSKILDIKAANNTNTVYVLDDRHLSRFSFDSLGTPSLLLDSLDLSSIGAMGEHLNRVIPLDATSCYLFSDNYDFCSGAYYIKFKEDGSLDQRLQSLEGITINDALPLGGDKILFGGSKGIMLGNSNGVYSPVFEPTQLTRFLLASWPKNLVLVIMGVLVFALLVWFVLEQYERIKRKMRKLEVIRKVEVWSFENDRILTKKEMEGHLKEVEGKEKEYGSLVGIISKYKQEKVFPHMDDFTLAELNARDTSGIEQCHKAIEEAEAAIMFTPIGNERRDIFIERHVLSAIRNRVSASKTSCDIEDIIQEMEPKSGQMITEEGKRLYSRLRALLLDEYDSRCLSEMRNLDVSGIEQCDSAIEIVKESRETLYSPESKKKANDIIKGILSTRDEHVLSSLLSRMSAAKTSQDYATVLDEAESMREQLKSKACLHELARIIEETKKNYDDKLISELETLDTSGIKKCTKAIEEMQIAKESIHDSKKKEKLNSRIEDLKKMLEGLINDEKIKLAAGDKKVLQDKYKGEYVVALFNTLVDVSDLTELKSNIDKFMQEESESVQIESKTINRFETLERIGQIISDVRTIAPGKVPEGKREAAELLSALEDIAARYDSIPDWYESFKEKGVFVPWRKVKELETNKEKKGTYEMQKATNSSIDSDLKYYHLYQDLRPRMRKKYKDTVKAFFDSYSLEDDKADAQFKRVFKDRKDETIHKWCFMLFALSAKTDVGMYLLGMKYQYFQKEKSTWKGLPTKDDKIHHLCHLMDEKEYAGLFGLIAKTAFGVIRKEGDGENRGRPQTKRRDEDADVLGI